MNTPTEFQVIRKLKEMLVSCVESRTDCGLSEWTDGPNPFYCQTASGLFLQTYYAVPKHVWTPWGKYVLSGSTWSKGGAFDEVLAEMLARCDGTLYKAGRYEPSLGEIGPIYALARVDDVVLPPAVERARGEYVDYNESKDDWRRLCEAA